jgi:hypothetical protein
MWFEWDTLEDFEKWHFDLCQKLNYPLTPLNQETGLPDESAQKVIAYTNAYEVEGKIIAWVDESESTGLVQTELRIPEINKSEI